MEIKQLISADGWAAVSWKADSDGVGYPVGSPLALWALSDDGSVVGLLPNPDHRFVVASGEDLFGKLVPAEKGMQGFLGYAKNTQEGIQAYADRAKALASKED